MSTSVELRDRGLVRSRVRHGSRAHRRRRWHGRPFVLGETLFRDVLAKEQKRADRFQQPFVLVLVDCKADHAVVSANWKSVIEALSQARRDTDVLGWFTRRSVLGMIVPEIGPSDERFGREIEDRVGLALTTHLGSAVRSDFTIHVHRYAGPQPVALPTDDAMGPLNRLGSVRHDVRSSLKRGLDICAAAALLAVLSPLFLVIAALVKRKSPGPIFFRQVRIGEFGRPFTMLKFRTMHVKNDDAIHKAFVSQLIKGDAPQSGNAADTPFKIVNDPRVTPVGRVLRKTSLDELPQLWNVLRGDMSLVGPRPPLQYEVEQYKPWHYRRVLEAKPGITGLWQVSGRSRTTFDDMVRLDLRYAKNPSAWTDIKILLATPRAVISGKGAC